MYLSSNRIITGMGSVYRACDDVRVDCRFLLILDRDFTVHLLFRRSRNQPEFAVWIRELERGRETMSRVLPLRSLLECGILHWNELTYHRFLRCDVVLLAPTQCDTPQPGFKINLSCVHIPHW